MTVQEEGGSDRDEKPLVGIDGDGVCQLDTCKGSLQLVDEHRGAAVTRIDMEPEVVTPTDLDDLLQRVDGTGAGRADRRGHGERDRAAQPIPFDAALEGSSIHGAAPVRGH